MVFAQFFPKLLKMEYIKKSTKELKSLERSMHKDPHNLAKKNRIRDLKEYIDSLNKELTSTKK